ncbi:MOP flippase family protein [Flavobacterium sp. N1719]|uniref:MOP flippase family protein n=1 Tax=Flavobacterium sp. N1719 TaxID=2885633 RepID=UPI0022238C7E|nr:MOP flippase family protein [Flavobacterium sp. N1719]
MSLKQKVTKSLIWTFSDQVVVQIANLFFGLYIARLLGPETFGIIGIVLMFTNFAQLFVDMGFGSAIIHNQQLNTIHFSSVFWINSIAALLLYFLFYLSAPSLALFFKQPILENVIRVCSLTLLLNAFCVVQFSLMVKELNFKRKAIINWISLFTGYGAALYMAYNGYGVWSVVGMYLTMGCSNVLVIWLTTKWKPSFQLNKEAIKTIWSYGIHAFGDNALNYWSRNFDNFIIGKCLGTLQLGLYTRAYSLMLLPVKNLSTVISKVFFPAFAQRQEDKEKLAKHYLQLIQYISLVTFPLLIGLSLVSSEFVIIFLGEKWRAMIPILSLLCIVGALQSIVTLNGVIYYSLGQTKTAFKISILVNITLIIAFVIGVNYGIKGVAWSYLIANILLFYPVYTTAIRLLNLSLINVFYRLKGILAALILMVAVISLIGYFINFTVIIAFTFKILIGTSVYLISLYAFERKLVIQIIDKGKKTFKKLKK